MMKADTAFAQAIENADKSALEKLLDADFTWTDAGGKVQTKDTNKLSREVPPAWSRTLFNGKMA
jgi:hypothetical protein